MKKRNSGTVIFVPSSGAAPYMGAYEVFKTAQVELCNTLSGELEGTNIITYSISPGFVKTEAAQEAIKTVSSLMGITTDEFYRMNEKHMLDVETAGVGFAVSIVNASQYNGQEIGSIQALIDVGIIIDSTQPRHAEMLSANTEALSVHIGNIIACFNEQYSGWLQRNVFERQWVLRDFRKTVGVPADRFQKRIMSISDSTNSSYIHSVIENKENLERLKNYYIRQHKLLQSYEKNPDMLKENSQIILEWVDEIQTVLDMI